MKKAMRYFLILLCLVGLQSVSAQQLLSITSDEGLSNTCIHSIIADSYDNVWVATRNGLNRWDGAKVNKYHHDPANPHSLLHDLVTTLIDDGERGVLVGTESGVQRYVHATDRFTTLPLITLHNDTIEAHIVSFCKLRSGTTYAFTAGRGFYHLECDTEGAAYFKEDSNLINSAIICMKEDVSGRLWVVDADGWVYRRHGSRMERLNCVPSAFALCEGSRGQIYLATKWRGVYVYNPDQDQFVPVRNNPSHFIISSIAPGHRDELLISTDGNGLNIYNELTGELRKSNIRTYEYNLLSSNVKAAIYDRSGNLWVGVYWKGVLVMPPLSTGFTYVGRRSVDRNTLGTNCVTAILGDVRDHTKLWVATDHCGVYHLSADGQSSVHFKPELVRGMPSTVLCMLEDSEGTFWVGSAWSGVAHMNKVTGECIPFAQKADDGSTILTAYGMIEDGHGNIWVATMGQGVYCYNLNSKTLRHFRGLKNNAVVYPYNVLNNVYVRCLLVHNGNLIVGTSAGLEVFRINPDFTLHKVDIYLPGYSINQMRVVPDGNLWVATSLGLACLDARMAVKHIYTTADSLSDNNVCSVEIAPDDCVWAGTDNGLSCLSTSAGTFRNYYISDGLQGNEFSLGASALHEGQLYFGGINGLTCFRPSEVGPRSNAGKIYLRVVDFYVGGKPIHVGDRSGRFSIVDQWVSQARVFNLCHSDNNFILELATLGAPGQRSTYYYSLNGDEWIPLGIGQNRLQFSGMKSGDYHIRLKAEYNGRYSDVHEVTVVIHPVWYLSWLAKVVYLVLFLVGCYLAYLQIREHLKAKAVLETQRKVEEMHEMRIQFFMNISHEIRTPMTLIVSPLTKLLSQDKDPARQRSYRLMYQNSQRILRLISQMMDARKVEKGQLRLKYEHIDLVPFIANLYELFTPTAQSKHIDFSFQHDMESLPACIDPRNFDKVVMNLLSNAFKFTDDNGTVTIALKVVPGHIEGDRDFVLTVTDSGVGIPDSDKKKVFERFYSNKNAKGYVGTGIGLNLTQSLVRLHEGTIHVEDNPAGQGARFVVRMPVAQQLAYDIADEHRLRATPAPEVEEANTVEAMAEMPLERVRGNKQGRILLVDDDAAIRRYLYNELTDSYTLHECANGEEAWKYVMENIGNIDLVISDVMMPIMDGMELCGKIKENYNTNHIPVILLTAKGDDSDRLEGLYKGVDAYLSKPFNMEVLRQTIANLISNIHKLKGKLAMSDVEGLKVEEVSKEDVDRQVLDKLTQIIVDRIADPDLSIEDIAQQMGMSRVHFHRRVKELSGITPRDYVKNIRLVHAAKLLTRRRMDVTDVSIAVGFRSLPTFSTSFKAYYNMSPKEYVKNYNEKRAREQREAEEEASREAQSAPTDTPLQ